MVHENDKNANNTNKEPSDAMLPCEFCDGLVPMRKLLEHQAACVNPTNVRRNEAGCWPSTSALSSPTKKLSCAEQMALESPMPSPSPGKKMPGSGSSQTLPRKTSSSSSKYEIVDDSLINVEDPASTTKVPCEFCNEPYSLDGLMRHQRACKKNPHITPSSQDAASTSSPYMSGSLRRQRHYSLSRTQSVRETTTRTSDERPMRALSRQNSFSDRSYLRRSESFYNRTSLYQSTASGRSAYSGTDYASAVRRSSLFDGYAGFSIYSSISQGLDEITYGAGRRSRRGSISDNNTYSSTYSRRGSISTGSSDYAALRAATTALEAERSTFQQPSRSQQYQQQQQQQQNAATTSAESGIGNSPKSVNLSRQNSTRMSNMSDSAYGDDYESSSPQPTPKTGSKHIVNNVSKQSQSSSSTMHKIQKSSSMKNPAPKQETIKHSKSSGKLERKVSFSEADPVKINVNVTEGQQVEVKQKSRHSKDKDSKKRSSTSGSEKKHRKSSSSKEAKLPPQSHSKPSPKSSVASNDFVDQVTTKLKALEQEQMIREAAEAAAVIRDVSTSSTTSTTGNTIDVSATVVLSSPRTRSARPHPKPEVQQQQPTGTGNGVVVIRERTASKAGSKRNSLDKQSVQSLASDLAAECAKAYALMESSLSKLSTDLGVAPFGLAPKNKKLRKSSSVTTHPSTTAQ